MADHAGTAPEDLRLVADALVLGLPAVTDLLADAARDAAAAVGLSCGITYMTGYGVLTVASSDALANAVDEIQYGLGDGPCLQALRTGLMVCVDELATESRWGAYRELALQAGVRSSLSFTLIIGDRPEGALNVYSTVPGPWPADQVAAAMLASNQAAGVLHAVRGLAGTLVRDPAAAARVRSRHELDIATGMLMAWHGYGHEAARAALAEQAGARGVSVGSLVTELMAEHQPEPDPGRAPRSTRAAPAVQA
jgi:GAF domain-containing protein